MGEGWDVGYLDEWVGVRMYVCVVCLIEGWAFVSMSGLLGIWMDYWMWGWVDF